MRMVMLIEGVVLKDYKTFVCITAGQTKIARHGRCNAASVATLMSEFVNSFKLWVK